VEMGRKRGGDHPLLESFLSVGWWELKIIRSVKGKVHPSRKVSLTASTRGGGEKHRGIGRVQKLVQRGVSINQTKQQKREGSSGKEILIIAPGGGFGRRKVLCRQRNRKKTPGRGGTLEKYGG